jgi:hypothetical protein
MLVKDDGLGRVLRHGHFNFIRAFTNITLCRFTMTTAVVDVEVVGVCAIAQVVFQEEAQPNFYS